jgi:hypothetical protein
MPCRPGFLVFRSKIDVASRDGSRTRDFTIVVNGDRSLHNAALDLRVLVPDPSRGRGFWFVNVTRSRSDGLSGFVGRLIRGKVQNEAQRVYRLRGWRRKGDSSTIEGANNPRPCEV